MHTLCWSSRAQRFICANFRYIHKNFSYSVEFTPISDSHMKKKLELRSRTAEFYAKNLEERESWPEAQSLTHIY
jgi:hypothetical protein